MPNSADDDIVDEGVYAEQDGATLTTEKALRQNQLKDVILLLAEQDLKWETDIHRLLDEGADVDHRYGRGLETLFQLLCLSLSETLHQLLGSSINENQSKVTSHLEESRVMACSKGTPYN